MPRLSLLGAAVIACGALASASAQTPDRTPDNFNKVPAFGPRVVDNNSIGPDGGTGLTVAQNGTGNQGAGDLGTGNTGTGNTGTGDKGTGTRGTGKKTTGNTTTGTKGTGNTGTGNTGTGNTGTGDHRNDTGGGAGGSGGSAGAGGGTGGLFPTRSVQDSARPDVVTPQTNSGTTTR